VERLKPRLLVVGEDGLARAGLRGLAEATGLEVVAELAPADLDGGTHEEADVAVWDLGARGSLAGMRALARRLPVVALVWADEQAEGALGEGARAVLLRERVEAFLLVAIRAVLAGLVTLDSPLADALLRPRSSPEPVLVEPLTPRELEVLQLVAEGLTNRGIGERLGISEHTAKFHVAAIFGKLGAGSRSEAVAAAARLGLLLL
jgi:two-component system nitrate/nitrite response regulator NarL